MTILVTGGAGFIGSHVAEFYARKRENVIVIDNLSRSLLLGKENERYLHNWNYLKSFKNIDLINMDIGNRKLRHIFKDVDTVIHTAAQTAVTYSITNPDTDFQDNAFGTFNVLEAIRNSDNDPLLIYTSTNKVYGDNVNKIKVFKKDTRYVLEEDFSKGISETFSIDHCEHTPYGCSKLAGDIYVQDYARTYGLNTAVYRMSCIYGPRQFGVEDQGWVAWFTIATVTEQKVNIYGDGLQVRDVLYISDLVNAFHAFIHRGKGLSGEVFNIGGGPGNTLSLMELLDSLDEITGKRSKIEFHEWRPSDQKVYISNISKAKEKLRWQPKINPTQGVRKLVGWVLENKALFNRPQSNLRGPSNG